MLILLTLLVIGKCLSGQEGPSAAPVVADIANAPDLGEPPAPTAEIVEELFNGQTLEGWTQRGGQAEFRVEDGAIVGKSRVGTPNSFLCTNREFGDFQLELEFRVDNDRINSGVQVRSASRPDYKNGRVHGYQVEIDPSARAWTGGIYDEARRGWLYTLKNKTDAQAAFKLGQWNRMRVLAVGGRIRTWINDVPVADLDDTLSPHGFIALQVHSTRESMPMEIRWRSIRLTEIVNASLTEQANAPAVDKAEDAGR